jgi:MoxR-like ATPase
MARAERESTFKLPNPKLEPYQACGQENLGLGPGVDTLSLSARSFLWRERSFASEAHRFVPTEDLTTSIHAALAVGDPLLLTGEPGTGKTQVAYYIAYRIGLGEVLRFQVKSDSRARDIMYEFDAVRYFYDAHVTREVLAEHGGQPPLDKRNYVEPRQLWLALQSEGPRVLLIDEIDKAPRDFPNDLLFEFDKMEFDVPETGDRIFGRPESRPVVVVTSNSERQLPDAFLRRCVYHHMEFSENLLQRVFEARREEFTNLHESVVALAMERFIALRRLAQRKRPATAEFLVRLRLLALSENIEPRTLEGDLSQLPYLGVLLKDRDDIARVRGA